MQFPDNLFRQLQIYTVYIYDSLCSSILFSIGCQCSSILFSIGITFSSIVINVLRSFSLIGDRRWIFGSSFWNFINSSKTDLTVVRNLFSTSISFDSNAFLLERYLSFLCIFLSVFCKSTSKSCFNASFIVTTHWRARIKDNQWLLTWWSKQVHQDQVFVLSKVDLFCRDFPGVSSRDSDTSLVL